jgi:hypothetical protein
MSFRGNNKKRGREKGDRKRKEKIENKKLNNKIFANGRTQRQKGCVRSEYRHIKYHHSG